MKKKRQNFSAADQAELWRCWQSGDSVGCIARVLDRSHDVVYYALSYHGGVVPRPRRRSARVLSLAEREETSRGIAGGVSIRQIAKLIGRAPSTVSREIARHGGLADYRAGIADERAWRLARRPKVWRLANNSRLRTLVEAKLAYRWSPEQISGWLKCEFANEPEMQVSAETIYRSLFDQARGVLKH